MLDDQYLQKYEPVLLTTGERCHQSADVLAQYTPNKQEFFLVKIEEKGKTENNNIVVSILNDYDPKTNPKIAASLMSPIINSKTSPNKANSESCTNETSSTSSAISSAVAESINQAMPAALLINENIISKSVSAEVIVHENEASSLPSSSSSSSSSSSLSAAAATNQTKYYEFKESFEIFIQVLSSQFLNVEFLVKIREMQEDYFRPSLEFIENLLAEKGALLVGILAEKFLASINEKLASKLLSSAGSNDGSSRLFVDLKPELKYLLENRPKMLLIESTASGSNDTAKKFKYCESLSLDLDVLDSNNLTLMEEIDSILSQHLSPNVVIKFDGSLYDSETLCTLGHAHIEDKEYYVCEKMFKFLSLMHSLKHFKFNLYELCSQKVSV